MNIKIIKLLAVFLLSALIAACASATNSQSNDSSNRQKESETILVMDITGNHGGGVSRNIESDASKAWVARGVDVVQGDYIDFDTIKAALDRVDHLFVNIIERTPNFVVAANHAFDAAHAAGVKNMVFTSNIIANPESGFPFMREG